MRKENGNRTATTATRIADLQSRLKTAEAQLDNEHSKYRTAREVAIKTTAELANVNYCEKQDVLDREGLDQELLSETFDNADRARTNLKRARNAVLRAQARVRDLTSALDRVKTEAAAEEKEAWLRKNKPKLFADLENVRNRYEEGCGVAEHERDTSGYRQRLLVAKESLAAALDACDRAYAERSE